MSSLAKDITANAPAVDSAVVATDHATATYLIYADAGVASDFVIACGAIVDAARPATAATINIAVGAAIVVDVATGLATVPQ